MINSTPGVREILKDQEILFDVINNKVTVENVGPSNDSNDLEDDCDDQDYDEDEDPKNSEITRKISEGKTNISLTDKIRYDIY